MIRTLCVRFHTLFAPLFLFVASALHAEKWEKLENCRLNETAYFDGDSFSVFHAGGEIIVRLYFVDCPETNESFPDRVRTQAGHFGKSVEETLHVGSYAKQATAQLLSRLFTVLTKYQDAKGQSAMPRYFGFVTTAEGKDLAEILVANGLARSYGEIAAPQGKNAAALKAKYDRLDDKARRSKFGLYSPQPLTAISHGKDLQLDKLTLAEAQARATPIPALQVAKTAMSASGEMSPSAVPASAPNHGMPWTAEQEQTLRDCLGKGVTVEDIAAELGRTPVAILARIRKLGLPEPSLP